MMKKIYTMLFFLSLLGINSIIFAQQELECNPTEGLPVSDGSVTVNFGSTTGASNFNNCSNVVLGQPLVGRARTTQESMEYGFWAIFLLPPQTPIVIASQGDFTDRNLISWKLNPLSSNPTDGFDIFRDGAFLNSVPNTVNQFIDFNVQAGELYEYSVVAKNSLGNSSPGLDIGFVNPNGVIQGQVLTRNGNPVPDCILTVSPTFGKSMQFDGVDDYLCVSYDSSLPDNAFTFSSWLKVDSYDGGSVVDMGSTSNKNWWLHTGLSDDLILGIGGNTPNSELTLSVVNNPTDWHHVAAVYNGQVVTVYLDGEYQGSMAAVMDTTASLFALGSSDNATDFFEGKLDDTRIYNRALSQTEIILSKDITANVFTEGLIAYWKYDEGQGRSAFDIMDTFDAEINGASFSDDTPDILNAAVTDANGDYIIQGINYSQASNMTVTPAKSFYKNFSLEFQAANQAYAELAAFDIPDTNTVEVVCLPFDKTSKQVILTNGSGTSANFQLYIENNAYHLTINGTNTSIGTPSGRFDHLAITTNSAGTGTVNVYQNGTLLASPSLGTLGGDWSSETWYVGAEDDGGFTNFYTGLVDKVLFYEKDFVQSNIQVLANTNPNPPQSFIDNDSTRNYLFADYGFNEGGGSELEDFGPNMLHKDAMGNYIALNHNTTYSIVARVQDESPHEFEPNSKNVVLNYSNTSVSNVDFTDISTVSVSGVIRFEDTFCYQDSVEILVNGSPSLPPIYTNSEGRFVADFEPGSNVILTPKYGSDSIAHIFSPTMYEVRRLNTPVANVLFQNKTKRTIQGNLFGGSCENNIIRTDANGDVVDTVWVDLRSLNGCYERQFTVTRADGYYKFTDIPPIPVSIGVARFDNTVNPIWTYFDSRGGQQSDLRKIATDTINFMYQNVPNIEYSPIGSISTCSNDLVLDFKAYETTFKVYEEYEGGRCYLDSATLLIKNEVANAPDSIVQMVDGEYLHEFLATTPNIIAPYTKKIEVSATTAVGSTDLTPPIEAIVLGTKDRGGSTFTSTSPPIVLDILRDPPGDGSTASREAGQETCGSFEIGVSQFDADNQGAELTLGLKYEKGIGFISSEVEIIASSENTWTHTQGWNDGLVEEVCYENNTVISTSEDLIGEEGDVYIGTTMNLVWGVSDFLQWNDTVGVCSVDLKQQITIEPDGFGSDFFYSHKYIAEELIPELEFLAENTQDTIQSDSLYQNALQWRQILAQEKARKGNRIGDYSQILTLDAGVSYENSFSMSTSTETTVGYSEEWEFENANALGGTIAGIGGSFKFGWTSGKTIESNQSNTQASSTTYSYNIADDDIGDAFAIGVILPNTSNIESSIELVPNNVPYEYFHDCEEGVMIFSSKIECEQDSKARYGVDVKHSRYGSTEHLKCKCFEKSVVGTVLQLGADGETYSPSDDEIKVGDLENVFYPDDLSLGEFPAPIFTLIAGTTSCPYEGGRRRDRALFSSDRTIASNINMNSAAVFRLRLGNESPSEDTREYKVALVSGTNPDGAIIEIDGFSISSIPYTIAIPYGEQREVTMTIRKGPVEFEYENIRLAMYADCEFDSVDAINGDLDEDVYTEQSFDVSFVEPCSSVEIGFPTIGHTVTPGNTNLGISLADYDENDPDLHYIAVQYRPVAGGSWINITPTQNDSLYANELMPVSTNVNWDMQDVRDGLYEIRAVAFCYQTSLAPGISTIIPVRKETEPPQLFGTPEPADGILTVGDEISITFNEQINCNNIFDADGAEPNINFNNIALINTETGKLVSFSSQCVGDRIVITPLVQSQFIDGKVLKARATAIEDLAGNPMSVPVGAPGSPEMNYKEWEFLVDLNPLRWEEGSNITEIKTEGDVKVVMRNIINNAGTAMNYTIKGKRTVNNDNSVEYASIPSWMMVEPKVGTLDPGEVKPITFVFPQDLLVDDYLTEINVVGSQGDNDITVDLKVRCPDPDWNFDRINDFENTMTFTVQVDVFGEITVDNSDRIAAFINGELRGSAYIEKVQAFDGLDNNGDGITDENDIDGAYMAFLTVYGDETDDPIIDFNFFDGSECIVYSQVIEEIPYEPTAQEGTPTSPTVLHLLDVVDRKIPLAQGWTWISVNLDLTDNSTNNVLNLLDNKDGDLIKDDNTFAQYVSDTWVGSMTDIGFEKRYMYFTPEQDTLCLTGMPYDPTTSTIPITNGWNWIGFVPQQGMTVDNALASLTPLNGDLVKSQIAFAQYISGFGWIGNLNVMQAPNGYLLNISNAGTLEYDPTLQARDVNVLEKREPTTPYWDINSSLYQHNMNITAVINPEDYQLEESDQIGVFAGGELRGYGEAIYVEPLKEHFLFITAYGDEVTEDLDFVLFSQRDSSLTNLNEIISFTPDRIVGTALEPFVFNIGGATAIDELDTALDVSIYPNPSRYEFNIEFNSPTSEQVNIQLLNVQGQVIETLDVDIPVGQHVLQYNARTLPSGVYNMTISGKDIQVQKKLIKIN